MKLKTWIVFVAMTTAQVAAVFLAAKGLWQAAGGLLGLVILFQLLGVLRLLARSPSTLQPVAVAGPSCEHELSSQLGMGAAVPLNAMPPAFIERMVAHGGLAAWRTAFEAYARAGEPPLLAVEHADSAALEYEKRLRRFHALPE